MRNVYTIICAGFVGFAGFTGFTAHAQLPSDSAVSVEEMVRSLTTGAGISTSDIVSGVTQGLIDTSTPTEQPAPTLEGQIVIEPEAPGVNRIIEAIDSKTKRYAPRLRVNFAEFPLRSLTPATQMDNENKNGTLKTRTGTPANALAQRVQSRLRVPQIDLAINDRTVIVSGTVTTERQRSLVESMLRFEPGIDRVQNEITVVPVE